MESVLNQTFRNVELIVVDDGSVDGTGEVMQRFDDPRLRYLVQENQGVSRARNRGIEAARFEWISFLDSDDFWTPEKLQRQIEAVRQNPDYRVFYSDEMWIRRGRRVNPRKKHRKYGGWIYHRCLPLCIISPSSILLHRQILSSQGVFDETFPVCEDYELWLRIAARHPVYFLPEKLIYKVGGHADQLSRSRWGMDRFRVRALEKIFHSGILTYQQRFWTAREIVEKSTILLTGFSKRQKTQEALHCRHKIHTYESYLNGGLWRE